MTVPKQDHSDAATASLSRSRKALILNLVRRAARAEILPRFRKTDSLDIRSKTDATDLVTAADTAAEAMITRGLSAAFPTALIVGEEACAANPGLRDEIAGAELCFLIDPVDGTWNYAHGMATFGTIIAACRYGRPVFGLIYDPLADDAMMADRDTAALLQPAIGQARRVRTASPKGLADLLGYVNLNLFEPRYQPEVAALFPRLRRVGGLQCSAHEYRMVAQGAMDFVISPSQTPWDHAAGVLIVERAGGHAAMIDGSAYSAALTRGVLIVASSRQVWEVVAGELSFLKNIPSDDAE